MPAGEVDDRRPRRLLILGGTTEAFELASRLAGRPDLVVTSALAGRTRRPRLPPGTVRIGGFGGASGLARYLERHDIDLLVDATHPFARRISAHAELAAAATGIELLTLARPGWAPPEGLDVLEATDLEAALVAAAARGRRALVTFRLDRLPPEAGGLEVVVRAVEPPARPLPARVVWRLGRGPFGVADECRLLERLRIDVVVAKASGGAGGSAKLEAARRLGRTIVLIPRASETIGRNVVGSVDDAVRRIGAQRRARST